MSGLLTFFVIIIGGILSVPSETQQLHYRFIIATRDDITLQANVIKLGELRWRPHIV